MGRKRTANKHLPRYVYLRRGRYYFWADRSNPMRFLGASFADAMQAYSALDVFQDDAQTMADVFARYSREIAPTLARPDQVNAEIARLSKVFGALRPADIEPQHVYKFLDLRGQKAPVAANRELARLSAVFSYAVRWGIVKINPCKQVRRLPERPRDRYVSDAEFALAHELASKNLRVLMEAAVLTGLRCGDLLALSLDQLEDSGIRCTNSKTGKTMLIEWSDELRRVVDRAKGQRRARVTTMARPLFVGVRGCAWTYTGLASAWQRLMRQLPPTHRFTFQDLRAKSASDGEGLMDAAKRLAHGDPRITDRVYMRAARRVRPLR